MINTRQNLARMFTWAMLCIAVIGINVADASTSITLTIKPYTITVNGKKATVYHIEQPNGTWGFEGTEGEMFDATVKNDTQEQTVLHWHGLIVPNNQDGVPGVTQLLIQPGSSYHYHFKLAQAGTYWMHSHDALQLQQLMSAPFIIRDLKDTYKNAQNVTLLLSDFSFTDPNRLFKNLKNNMQMSQNSAMDTMPDMPSMSGSHIKENNMNHHHHDLNDVQYDAFLTNYRTLQNPEIITVQPNSLVRLRIIEGAAASNFFIHAGKLAGTLIAVDGQPIKPLATETVPLTMGQRADILVKIPAGEGSYPILAQVEGTLKQTGLILKTTHAKFIPVSETATSPADAMGLDQELQLQALHPLLIKPIDRKLSVDLEGDMEHYVWEINHQVWPDITPLVVKKGERVEITFTNHTGMSHPMHLHGHVFEITEINGKKFHGALRDTVLIPANSTVKVQLDADNPGTWMLHCHVLYHAAGGMMTLMNYEKPDSANINLYTESKLNEASSKHGTHQ